MDTSTHPGGKPGPGGNGGKGGWPENPGGGGPPGKGPAPGGGGIIPGGKGGPDGGAAGVAYVCGAALYTAPPCAGAGAGAVSPPPMSAL